MQFNERLISLMKKEGLSNYRLARDLGTTSAVVGRWVNGKSAPGSKHLDGLSKRFGVSVDYLMGNTESTEVTAPEPEEILDSISVGGVHLSITNRNISNDDLMEVVDFLREQQRRNGH